ncbi:MAG: ATP-dependent DNA helicase [Candidatus Woesearchaeota archaeon]|nr:ATP-dependent DNA helicase [Candidatus Woesearchaeota archaeon]
MTSLKKFYFPYESLREVQKGLILKVDKTLSNKSNILVHAPTGLGKTAATLCPAIKHAIEEDLTIFFLTSRHTQHLIAIETLQKIKDKFNTKIISTDLVGKKWMCPVPGTDRLYSNEFAEYCKAVRESGKCEFYQNTKKKSGLSPEAQLVLKQIEDICPCHSEKIVELCSEHKICPYEINSALARKSRVIIADYYYIFNPFIQKLFFAKTGKELEKSIIIVDEAHNLAKRVRSLLTQRMSNFMLSRAIKEAKKFGLTQTKQRLQMLQKSIEKLSKKIKRNEIKVTKRDFIVDIKNVEYYKLVEDFKSVADTVRATEKQSYIGGIASFLEAWAGPDQGYVRIISRKRLSKGKKTLLTLSYRCLDPSLLSKDILDESYSTILMSGTLTPLDMYKDILGAQNAATQKYKSTFPTKNKLSLIIPETTTKYSERNQEQYKRIAEICSEITNIVPGNSIIFFPSYKLRDSVNRYFINMCEKTTFSEIPGMSKKEKRNMLEKFKDYNKTGAVLLGVVSGSYGEGIDLPGDLLKAAIIVGLPLQVPDLETKALIKYYDEKFNKGWDYGYLFPAINRAMQSAGRVIRSKTDKGAVIFLDERYGWSNYYRCLPKDSPPLITRRYADKLKKFFEVE